MNTNSWEEEQACMSGSVRRKDAIESERSEMDGLLHLSARIGHEPLLVQASNGNTSLKIDGTLWIKASGKWLEDADRQGILVPAELSECLECFRQGAPLPQHNESARGGQLRPSVETFMHAILPQRVVVHVHSVNTIAWSVRSQAPLQLAERLRGLRWQWVPYAPSGLPLARAVQGASARSPGADVFVLGNHGLVVCGEDWQSAEDLLFEVERRLAINRRFAPPPCLGVVADLQDVCGWRWALSESLDALGTDAISRRIMQGGILYPCQAIFLGRTLPQLRSSHSASEMRRRVHELAESASFLIVEGGGVLMHERITAAESAVLTGFAEVVRRIEGSAPLRYMTIEEVNNVMGADGHHYRMLAESESKYRSAFAW